MAGDDTLEGPPSKTAVACARLVLLVDDAPHAVRVSIIYRPKRPKRPKAPGITDGMGQKVSRASDEVLAELANLAKLEQAFQLQKKDGGRRVHHVAEHV